MMHLSVNSGNNLFTEEMARESWGREVDAYTKQCEFLIEYRGEYLEMICVIFKNGGQQALKAKLAEMFCEDPLVEVKNYCELWKELAKQ